MALRRILFTEYGLVECWAGTMSDDLSIVESVRKSGRRLAYVTSVLMLNQETCRLIPFFYWVRRQMLFTKLYHPSWPAILTQCLLISLPQLILIAAFVLACSQDNTHGKGLVLLQILGIFAFYWLGVLATLFPMERGVQYFLQRQGEQRWRPTMGQFAMLLPAVFVTQLVYTLALVSLHFVRDVDWRGVHYQLLPGGKVKLLDYKPYAAIETPSEASKGETDSL